MSKQRCFHFDRNTCSHRRMRQTASYCGLTAMKSDRHDDPSGKKSADEDMIYLTSAEKARTIKSTLSPETCRQEREEYIMKKKLLAMATAVVMLTLFASNAMACSMLYVGSSLTEDGGTYFSRSEDISNSQNKVFYVSPAGKHKAGEEYTGCYGFTTTFTKDSFAYTAVRDDNLLGTCPDCGGTHPHTPYEEVGTNEKGVSMTATVTLGANQAMRDADPTTDTGIEEADITTVVLGQAETAREGLDILMGIYDEKGAQGGSGIIIADQTETWYIENCSGTQYIAMRLPDDMIFISPNMCAIGVIDLDDENVIASSALIETAQKAGTFVGDADANIIDYRASYSNASVNDRIVNGIAYLDSEKQFTTDTLTDADFTISNVKDGELVGLYTNITADRKITTRDMVDFYKVDAIGNTGNLEYHVFQIYADGAPEISTTLWLGMDHGAYGVMVPYYPMLTTDTYAAYQVGTEPAAFVTEEPTGDVPYYPTTRRDTEGFRVLPENWADSYYWSFDAVSNTLLFVDDTQTDTVLDTYAALQEEIYASFEDMKAEAEASQDFEALKQSMTAASSALAQKAHKTAVLLYETISK